ncbi:TonB-dependent receptor [Dyadobacter pollutisoli]|uniref:TonB-dependent receptor n=1 Tax=Dyadobacter pollutisoli TaxID=2910158 RepID=A0A9E8SQJ5_9BACT|nr:TonB-dependent receptor [Dyadobacter pollutisoli]WAC13112.1 TonB-dependent receptor [Dyadobacter pollutisoli]
MKRILLLLFISAFPSISFCQSLITGRIIDDNNLSLPGATIKIEELSRGTVSDQNGNYTLIDVPNGVYNLTVTYIGYGVSKQKVAVAGRNVKTDFKLNLADNNLQAVVVTGNRSATLKALNQQKNSDRIVNVISADQVGRFPDPNIGDALKRVPGIYVQLDQGEASLVSIRGTDPSKSTININGSSIAGTGENRAVGISAIPADMVQSVEVTKAITPDMDGDAIGGVVNLVTRKAPFSRLLSVTAGTGYSDIVQKPAYNANLVYGDRFLKDKKLGVMASISYYRQFLGSDDHQTTWEDVKWVDQQTYFMPRFLNMVQNNLERIRQSYTVGIDYKLNAKNTLTFTGIYNKYNDWRKISTLKVDDIGAGYPKNWQRAAGWEGNRKITDANNDYIDDVAGEYYLNVKNDPKHPVYQPELERHIEGGLNNRNGSQIIQKIINFGLEGEHILGKVKVNWKGSYLKNVTDRPDVIELELESENEKSVQMDYTNPRFIKANNGFEVENILENLKDKPSYRADSADTWYMDNFTGTDKRASTHQYLAQLDIAVALAEGKFSNVLKFGGKYRGLSLTNETTRRVRWTPQIDPALRSQYEAELAAGKKPKVADYVGWAPFWSGFANNSTNISKTLNIESDYNVGNAGSSEWISNLNKSYYGDTEDFMLNRVYQDVLGNNYYGDEAITAGYVMSTQNFGDKLSLILGGRVEHSSVKYEGYNYNVRADFIPAKQSTKSEFLNFMPAFLARYAPAKNQVYRFAYTSTISRPNYKDISPYISVNVRDKVISQGNPDIKPTLSNNFDLLGELYTGNTGLVSAGVYFKNITNYRILSRDLVPFSEVESAAESPESLLAQGANPATVASYKTDYDKLKASNGNLERTRPGNGGTANILGMEFSFQQGLSFLPKPFNNLTLYSNYTHNFIFVKKGDPKLPGTAADILNLSLAYEVKKFNIRLSYNNTSDFVTILGTNSKGDVYYDKAHYLDASINYFLTPKLSLYATANNLLNQDQRRYQYKPEYTYSSLYTGATATIGLKFNLY